MILPYAIFFRLAAWSEHLKRNPLSLTTSKKQLPAGIFVSYDFVEWLRTQLAPGEKLAVEVAIEYASALLVAGRIRAVPNNTELEEADAKLSGGGGSSNEANALHYGFFLYILAGVDVEKSLRALEASQWQFAELREFCSARAERKECNFTSRTLLVELTNTPFNIRNTKSKFAEWCRVGVKRCCRFIGLPARITQNAQINTFKIYYERSYQPRKGKLLRLQSTHNSAF